MTRTEKRRAQKSLKKLVKQHMLITPESEKQERDKVLSRCNDAIDKLQGNQEFAVLARGAVLARIEHRINNWAGRFIDSHGQSFPGVWKVMKPNTVSAYIINKLDLKDDVEHLCRQAVAKEIGFGKSIARNMVQPNKHK